MKQLLLMAISIFLLGLTSCSTTNTNPDRNSVALGHAHSEDELAELCKNPGTDAELIETCKQLRLVYYKDLIDGGNNVFEPGCHRKYDNPQCNNAGRLFRSSGDLCQSQTRIAEWTNPACHGSKPVDSSKFDCNAECIRQGAMGGVCVTDKNFCATGIDSAHCECIST